MTSSTMTVTIPASEAHQGFYTVTVTILDTCPKCAQRRGDVFETHSFDGSRRLNVSGWVNPCGHVDKYSAVRKEAATNGLNTPAPAGQGW